MLTVTHGDKKTLACCLDGAAMGVRVTAIVDGMTSMIAGIVAGSGRSTETGDVRLRSTGRSTQSRVASCRVAAGIVIVIVIVKGPRHGRLLRRRRSVVLQSGQPQ